MAPAEVESPFALKAHGSPMSLDGDAAARGLRLLADPEAGVQLLSAPSGRRVVLPGADVDGLVAAARDLAAGVSLYVCLNPVPPGLDVSQRAARVPDVLRRRWLMVDVDAARPDTHLPATDAEHEAARQVAYRVVAYLEEKGWPRPAVVDSGNGWHLLYRVDLPNDLASRALCANCLRAVALAFRGVPGASVDAATFKANQNTKLPGSWSRKGESTEERPHRKVVLVLAPDPVGVVPADCLFALAAPLGPPTVSDETQVGLFAPERQGGAGETSAFRPKAETPSNGHASPFLLTATAGRDDSGPHPYAAKVLRDEVGKLAATPQGGRAKQAFESAAAVGNYLVSGRLGRDEAERQLLAACRGCGLPDAEAAGHVARGLSKGESDPKAIAVLAPARNGRATSAAGSSPAAEPKAPQFYRFPDLMTMDLPAPRWAVPGIMSEGLSILAGKPKLGKSWLALNLAITIAAGGRALGAAAAPAGDVLYLSLEDRLRRVQDRGRKLLAGRAGDAPARLQVAVEFPRIDQGGLDHVEAWLKSAEHPRLIVVDVWAKIRPAFKSGSQYDHDYAFASALKQIGDRHGVSVLALHHCKKAAADDIVDEISGTLGLAGAADGLLILTRARNENDGTLFITGRDVEEQELAVAFDPQTFVWTCQGNAAERTESKLKTMLIDVFKANAGSAMSISQLAEKTDCLDDRKRQYLRCVLGRMSHQGQIENTGMGRYRWAVQTPGSTHETVTSAFPPEP